jgi:hypothetical protein
MSSPVALNEAKNVVEFEIWENVSGLWHAQMINPASGLSDGILFRAESRGQVIALVLYRVPLSHMCFSDRLNPVDP